MKKKQVDLCIIGAGAAGLSVAAVAAQLDLKVVLIENAKMGGDCLNYGCVPSKALLAAAKHHYQAAHNSCFGLSDVDTTVDYSKIKAHIDKVIASIAVNDSQQRFEKLGAKVIRQSGAFINPTTFKVGEQLICAKRFVIASGSSPSIPPIPGLENIDYLSNETIFKLTQQPKHLVIIGAGPIGCEMAQAHCMLGTKVTVLEAFKMMPHDDNDLVDELKQCFQQQGITIHEEVNIEKIEKQQDDIVIHFKQNNQQQTVQASHLLVAAGRKANITNLGLEKAKVKYHERGIEVSNQLRTSNKRIYAIGDVAGAFQFTHIASYHAGLIIKNCLFHLRRKVDYSALPWVTYTLPELAHVGLSEMQAKKTDSKMKTLNWPFKDNDRAQAEHETQGKIKVFVSRRGKILGVSILGANAGELLAPWSLAISQGLKIADIANLIIPYPTLSEINKRVAGSYFTDLLFSKRMKWIVKILNKIIP